MVNARTHVSALARENATPGNDPRLDSQGEEWQAHLIQAINMRMDYMSEALKTLYKQLGHAKSDAHSSATHTPTSQRNKRKKKPTDRRKQLHDQVEVFSNETEGGRSRLEGQVGPKFFDDSLEQ
ncbi:hypothetical protein Nepgr_027694 [Nepenthes gracilis]|uniref:Uncharacterized protein n=1 Tax=Nepenthes gracilis TaxID=150966 RepID=A0AAD3TBU8_NEPGR|nr:hypothetical protein Nepgr_027694 [Nepenthes gracilis]